MSFKVPYMLKSKLGGGHGRMHFFSFPAVDMDYVPTCCCYHFQWLWWYVKLSKMKLVHHPHLFVSLPGFCQGLRVCIALGVPYSLKVLL